MNFPNRFFILVIFISGLGLNKSIAQTEINPKPSFKEQLKVFTHLGFKPENDLLMIFSRERYESSPYSLLYMAFGSSYPKEGEWVNISNNCLRYDPESIYKVGSYVRLLNDLSRISNGELNFTNSSDILNPENEKAYVSFTLNGDEYNWELTYYDFDHKVDPTFLNKIDELSKFYKTKGKLTYYTDSFGEIVLGWLTESELKRLFFDTRLNVVWYASRE